MSRIMTNPTWLAGVPHVLAGALLAAGCGDVVSPARHGPVAAAVGAAAATGIVLDQLNGSLSENGRMLIKGFNPTNPHHGDTIIATFFWLGSTNIIDSVTDVLTTTPYTPVGNTYNLVDYVTAGGVSMATYVATNVQNFPDPNTSDAQVLAVRANLSDSVVDGGVLISAWSGVAGTYAQALGNHSFGSGSGSSYPTVADPGPIAVNAGALVYGVTMSSALVGRDPPTGFGTFAIQSDTKMVDEADTAVQASAGTVDPRWNWYFNSPSTWLASVLALNPAAGSADQPPIAAFSSSCSALTCTFTNTSSDPDGSISAYSWTFGDGGTSTAQNPSHSYATGGTYTVTITVTDNQGATSAVSHTVTVTAPNQPPTAAFSSSCSGLTCAFTSTSSDPDGTIAANSWTFGDGGTATVQNPSRTYAAGGTYTVTLTVTDNQGATNAVSHSVTVTAPNQPPTVNAGSDQTVLLAVLYTETATFSDPDNDGPYSWTINWGDGTSTKGSTSSSPISATHTYLLLGKYTVTVTVTDSRGASGSDAKVLTVIL